MDRRLLGEGEGALPRQGEPGVHEGEDLFVKHMVTSIGLFWPLGIMCLFLVFTLQPIAGHFYPRGRGQFPRPAAHQQHHQGAQPVRVGPAPERDGTERHSAGWLAGITIFIWEHMKYYAFDILQRGNPGVSNIFWFLLSSA